MDAQSSCFVPLPHQAVRLTFEFVDLFLGSSDYQVLSYNQHNSIFGGRTFVFPDTRMHKSRVEKESNELELVQKSLRDARSLFARKRRVRVPESDAFCIKLVIECINMCTPQQ